MELVTNQVNRYQEPTPTSYTSSGLAISSPLYLSLTAEQAKSLLNGYRDVKRKQLMEMGFSESTSRNGLQIIDHTNAPITDIEKESGFSETALRTVIFGRSGIAERIVLKLQKLTGVYVVTRDELVAAQTAWIDALYEKLDLNKAAKTTSTTSTKPKTRRTAKSTASKPKTTAD